MSAHPKFLFVFSGSFRRCSSRTIPSLTSLGMLLSLAMAGSAHAVFAQTPTAVPVLTWRYDLTHAGQNTKETALSPDNVNASTFGKLFSLPVDSTVYAQPLYVPNLTMSDGLKSQCAVCGHGERFHLRLRRRLEWRSQRQSHLANQPADRRAWRRRRRNRGALKDTGSPDVAPTIGITGTPAINPATNTMYVVAGTKESGAYFSRLHAINIITGAEQPAAR